VRRVIRLYWVSRMEHGPQAQISLRYPIARGNCPLTIPTSYDSEAPLAVATDGGGATAPSRALPEPLSAGSNPGKLAAPVWRYCPI
jgi:hypothetical protein